MESDEGFRRTYLPLSGSCWPYCWDFPLRLHWPSGLKTCPTHDYVSDYAHVLSAETVARLDRIAANWTIRGQLAVGDRDRPTMDGTTRRTTPTGSKTSGRWQEGSDRGVLFLLAVNEHKYRIDVGYGLEGILPDGKVATLAGIWSRSARQRL